MSAEDYIDVYDWYEEPSKPSSAWNVTCKYCGESGLHWTNTKEGWRLSSNGVLHHCQPGQLQRATNPPHPTPASILASTTVVSQVFSSTSKEPIMDKNAVAFVRNDVISLGVQFPSGPNSSTQLDPKTYTYLSTDRNIVVGDWVIVQVGEVFKCACVTVANGELEIEPNAAVTYKFIVGKVDTSQYTATLEANAKIAEMLKTSYRSTLREGFRQTLLAGLGAEKQASLSLILNTTSKE